MIPGNAIVTIEISTHYHSYHRDKRDIVIKCICTLLLLIAVLLLIIPLSVAQADAEAEVLQEYITEQTMTVFTDSELQTDELKCSISSQNAEIIASGSLSDVNALTKTTVLVDISTSMPNAARDGVITTIKKLIEYKSANEEFKLVAFGDDLEILHDFTSDRYDLASEIEKITFNGNQSKIYDAIYNTIPTRDPSDIKPIFYRTIVITDGVDDTVSGITKEELFLRFQDERYPVDVVAVGSEETADNKELSAIVRMSGGRYCTLNPGTDFTALAQILGVSDYFYFEVKVPDALLDGTTRQVDIGDGVSDVSIDVKFPVFNTPQAAAEYATPEIETPSDSAVPETAQTQVSDETAALKANTAIFGSYTVIIFVSIGAAVLIIIAVFTLTVIHRKKKKTIVRTQPNISVGFKNDSYAGKTEFIGEPNYADTQYTTKLSNAHDPSKTWTLPIIGDVLIGRAEHCSVRLDDKSVSREQCKIAVQGNGLVLVHLGATNKTTLNGSSVVGSAPLQSGDTLKFGREILHVDYIQTLGNTSLKPEPPRSHSSGSTESIF